MLKQTEVETSLEQAFANIFMSFSARKCMSDRSFSCYPDAPANDLEAENKAHDPPSSKLFKGVLNSIVHRYG
eukprot:12261422-Karenia_brevis.AAC.1